MNKKVTQITLAGKTYPYRITMGAFVRFKNATGRDVSTLAKDDVTDNLRFVHCCILSACKADGVEFPYDFEDFADLLSPEDMGALFAGMAGAEGDADEKKTKAKA